MLLFLFPERKNIYYCFVFVLHHTAVETMHRKQAVYHATFSHEFGTDSYEHYMKTADLKRLR